MGDAMVTGGWAGAGRAAGGAGRARLGDAERYADESDDRLVARALAGERAAFAAIVARHGRAVRRLAGRLLGDPDDADDATQEAFVRAYVHLARFRPGSSLPAWLHAIVANWCRDQLRQRRAEQRRTARLEVAVGTGEEGPEGRLLRAERQADLQRRVAALPESYRQVLALRYDQELSYDEIGRMIARPVSTVRMRLLRARRALAAGLAADALPALGGD